MKRSPQFVALALLLLVVAQPVLADTGCIQPPQAVTDVVVAEAGCSYSSCWLSSASPTLPVAMPPKVRLAGSTALFTQVAHSTVIPAVLLAARPAEDAAAHATAKYILFQVFRI
jgi:hypothetical protein